MSSFKSPTSLPARSSPFRRPQSPSSPSSFSGRPSTPPSTRNAASPMTSPSKLKQSYSVSEEEEQEASIVITPTKSSTNDHDRDLSPNKTLPPSSTTPTSTRRLPSPEKSVRLTASHTSTTTLDPLSRLPPALLHSLRESFSVLDPNSTGTISPASVHETLQALGLDTSAVRELFPPGAAQSVTLPQYLNQLASFLVNLTSQQELLNAFSAFDEDDSGQIDVAELKRAVMSVVPDAGEQALTERDFETCMEGHTGRRILGRGMTGIGGVRGIGAPAARKGGEVFRYQEFVGGLMGRGIDPGKDAVRA